MEHENQYETQRYDGPGFGNLRLAHAYIPYQRYSNNYSAEEALRKGTLYPELWMPYRPGEKGYY